MQSSKIEVLKSALNVIETAQEVGKVEVEGINTISIAIALGILPPAVLPGRKPLEQRSVDAKPGTWPHFAAVLVTAVKDEWDGRAMRAEADAKREAAKPEEAEKLEKRISFFKYALSAIRQAFYAAIRVEQAEIKRQEAEAKRQAEEERKAAEERLSAEERAKLEAEREAKRQAETSKLAALEGLKSAAKFAADVAPPAAKPKPEHKPQPPKTKNGHPRLSIERVKKLLDGAIKRNMEQEGMNASEACRSAAQWMSGVVVRDRAEYSGKEIGEFLVEIKVVLHKGLVLMGMGISEAQRDADQKVAALLQEGQPKPERKRNGNGQHHQPQSKPRCDRAPEAAPVRKLIEFAPKAERTPEEIKAFHAEIAQANAEREARRAEAEARENQAKAAREAKRQAEAEAEARREATKAAREKEERDVRKARKGKPKRDRRAEAQAE